MQIAVDALGSRLLGDDRAAVAAGQPALLNTVFGTVLVLVGTPIYFFYRGRNKVA